MADVDLSGCGEGQMAAEVSFIATSSQSAGDQFSVIELSVVSFFECCATDGALGCLWGEQTTTKATAGPFDGLRAGSSTRALRVAQDETSGEES